MTFSSEEEAYEFYNNYAKKKGFSIRKSIIRRDLETDMIIFRRYYCSRSGYRDNKYLDKPDRKRSGPRLSRCGCPFELCIKLDTEVGKWRVSSYIGDHNHSLEPRDTVPFLRSHCRMNEAQKFEIADFQDSGVCNYQILDLTKRRNGGYEDRGFQSKNLYNFSLDHERCTMLADDAESILKYFKERKKLDPDFYSKYDAKDGHLTRLFWADGQSVLDYANFGDVVIFDSTYQLNRYNMVVVPFLGCNHHRSTIIFACGIVSREDKKSYEWLLEALMEAMYQVRPESVITDGDLAMREAINIVLRDTTHRLCTWHMGENAKKYIRGADVFRMFHKLMSKAYSAEEFEHKWREFEDKASKRPATRNWLSHIYSSKHLWAGAFVSKRVFLGMSTSQRSESINSKLHKYMNCKMSLCKAVQQMERYITRMRTKEAELDCKASQTEPILTTPVPNLEKSAAFYYTPRIFAIVRKEIEKAIEFVVDQNSKDVTCLEYIVSLRGRTETLATVRCLFLSGRIGKLLCTCSKFECDKIPCSHMFAVLMHLQITFIPQCCVSDRWTITAKSVFPSDRKGGVFKVNEQQQRYHELTKLGNRLFYEASKSSSEYVRTKEYLDEELKRHKDNGRIFKKCKVEKDEVSEDTESMQKIRNPKIVVTKGAPKKKKYERIHSSVEGRKNKCGHCGMRGHNRQTCQHLSQDNDDDNGSGSKSVPGVAVLFTEPPEARKPDIRWCLYIFKGGKMLNEPLNVHRQSCYLFGTERRVADIPTDHPSCSKQHAVLQYRQVEKEQPDGMMEKQVRPYLMDLDSTNGTFINDNRMEPRRYYGLCEKDTIKFGNSSWEYVLLRENSSA